MIERRKNHLGLTYAESFVQRVWASELSTLANPAAMILGASIIYATQHSTHDAGYYLLLEAYDIASARILHGLPDDPWTKWRKA